jgi:predicted nucleic acid-binding protein
MIILDTNVVSALMREPTEELVREWLNRQPRTSIWTTAVTVMEIRFGLAIRTSGRQRNRLERAFEDTMAESINERILPFDTGAAERTTALMAVRRQAGRSGELRDSMIAGIAIARHATLATRNVRHFADLPVSVINPWAATEA